MTLTPDRRAMLEAIAAAPADDLPRLVYADWLDEHAASDADHARAEFIRISCQAKPKARITKAEQEWLAANWVRMLPTLAGRVREMGGNPLADHKWSGRWLKCWVRKNRVGPGMVLDLEFWRGFARRVTYVHGFDRVAGAVAADEPLARHEPADSTTDTRVVGNVYERRVLASGCHGRAVWDRLTGHDAIDHTNPRFPRKVFAVPWDSNAFDVMQRRVLTAVAAAMTGEARHLAGLPLDLPTLGE